MQFSTSVIDLIRERKSKRTYQDEELSTDELEKINDLLVHYHTGPMGNVIKFSLVKKDFAGKDQKVKIGTYGFIKGAKYFIAGEVKNNEYCFEDFGYLLEIIILHLTSYNLGTCWLGGTFNRKTFSGILELENDSLIPAITPVGYAAGSKSIRENIIRWAADADNRMDWSKLFFENEWSNPLNKEKAYEYNLPLEMIRLAPSASNKQPWRIFKIENEFHFFLKRTSGYNKMYKLIDLQRVDMGIAMSHFELSCNELGLKGKWNVGIQIKAPSAEFEYIISWKSLP